MVSVKKLSLIALPALFLTTTTQAYEMHLGAGLNYYSVKYLTGDAQIDSTRETGSAYHFSWGLRNSFGESKRHFIGAGLDIDDIAGKRVLGLKAIDYQYALTDSFRLGAFIGAASMDSGLPQNGYYYGASGTLLELLGTFDLIAEFRYGSGLARDRILEDDPDDPILGRPDIFNNYYSAALSLSYRF
ncbi:hypothetical protein SAMN02745866_03836 [Alteromonadaceae bacterium Bs31]|nr:hypothetical protein SAMN02745866_03836 [Alteromonadaceae bacterium Bs31]